MRLVYLKFGVLELRMKKEDWYRRNLAAKQIGGIPMGLQYSLRRSNHDGTVLNMLWRYAVAAFTAGSKIEQIFTQAYVAQGTASATCQCTEEWS